jgi:hypothetical protein
MGKKITQLATITEVADNDFIVGVDVSDTSGSDNGTNKKFTKASLLEGLAPLDPQRTGWNPDEETWVYHNVDDPTGYFKIEGKDVSANYSVGWRIMFTNGGNVIKGIITAIAYSDPDTIITFLHEIDPTDNQALYLLTNSAITENYFSPHKAPLGFPVSPAKWMVEYTITSSGAGNYKEGSTVSQLGSLQTDVPIGSWKLSYRLHPYLTTTSASYDFGQMYAYEGISTSSSSFSSELLKGALNIMYNTSSAVGNQRPIFQTTITAETFVTHTSKTTYYVIGQCFGDNNQYVRLFANLGATGWIRAECAYL